jgi:hypothetical protein
MKTLQQVPFQENMIILQQSGSISSKHDNITTRSLSREHENITTGSLSSEHDNITTVRVHFK